MAQAHLRKHACLAHIATKLNKTLKLGNPDANLIIQLEEAVKLGQVSERLAAATGHRACPKRYSAMKADLETLIEDGHFPTLNICLQWTCEHAQHVLASGNIDKFVASMRVWGVAEDTERAEDNLHELWGMDQPSLWPLAPTQDEEDTAHEELPEKPELPAEVIVWEEERAWDKFIQGWGPAFLTGWSCDAAYDLMRANPTKASQLFDSWLSVTASMPEAHGLGKLAF